LRYKIDIGSVVVVVAQSRRSKNIHRPPYTSNGRAFFPVAMSIDFFGTEFVYYIIIIGQTLKDF
jgi:hypothetical protein